MHKLDQFLKIHEAAKYLGVCRNTLRNWCRHGKIPEHRHPVNNYRLFKSSDLDRLLKEAEHAVSRVASDDLPHRPR